MKMPRVIRTEKRSKIFLIRAVIANFMHLLIYAAKRPRRRGAADRLSTSISVLDTGNGNEHAVALARHCFCF
jgi:hypothetical protein